MSSNEETAWQRYRMSVEGRLRTKPDVIVAFVDHFLLSSGFSYRSEDQQVNANLSSGSKSYVITYSREESKFLLHTFLSDAKTIFTLTNFETLRSANIALDTTLVNSITGPLFTSVPEANEVKERLRRHLLHPMNTPRPSEQQASDSEENIGLGAYSLSNAESSSVRKRPLSSTSPNSSSTTSTPSSLMGNDPHAYNPSRIRFSTSSDGTPPGPSPPWELQRHSKRKKKKSLLRKVLSNSILNFNMKK